MKSILNKSARPIQVPLPRGKKVHLGPHRTAEIANNAAEHPPLVKLVEAGDIEILGDGGNSQADPRKASIGSASTPANRHQGATSSNRSGSGDR